MNIKANGSRVETLQKYKCNESREFSEVKSVNTFKLMQLQLRADFVVYTQLSRKVFFQPPLTKVSEKEVFNFVSKFLSVWNSFA